MAVRVFGIFVEDYRSKPLHELQLTHWTAICELGHSTTILKLYLNGERARTLNVSL